MSLINSSKNNPVLNLEIPLEKIFLAPVLQLVEVFAGRNAKMQRAQMRLRLVCEELLGYLITRFEQETIKLNLSRAGRFLKIKIIFKDNNLDFSGLNVVNIHGQNIYDNLESSGLLIAAMTSDKLTLTKEGACSILTIYIEQDFNSVADDSLKLPTPLAPFIFTDNLDIMRIALIAAAQKGFACSAPYFNKPDSFFADYDSGQIKYICVCGSNNLPAGFILWNCQHGTASFEGPYVFASEQEDTIGLLLLERLIILAAEKNQCIITKNTLSVYAHAYFEQIGTLYYRSLKEDSGGLVWTCPNLQAPIQIFYDSLDIQREFLTSDISQLPERSLITVDFDKNNNKVKFIPLIIGMDFESLLRAHVAKFSEKSCQEQFFIFRLSQRAEVLAAGSAVQCGFEFAYIIPGESVHDVGVLKYAGKI